MVPTSGYHTLNGGYSHLGHSSVVPLASSSRSASHNGTSGSVGLSSLRLRDSSNTPNTPTIEHSGAPATHPGAKDIHSRTYIVPVGYGF